MGTSFEFVSRNSMKERINGLTAENGASIDLVEGVQDVGDSRLWYPVRMYGNERVLKMNNMLESSG